jgi:hypothetical protein
MERTMPIDRGAAAEGRKEEKLRRAGNSITVTPEPAHND